MPEPVTVKRDGVTTASGTARGCSSAGAARAPHRVTQSRSAGSYPKRLDDPKGATDGEPGREGGAVCGGKTERRSDPMLPAILLERCPHSRPPPRLGSVSFVGEPAPEGRHLLRLGIPCGWLLLSPRV